MSNPNKDIQVNVRERIFRPIGEVFDAVVDPVKMSNYFISSTSGPMKRGPVTWEFPDLGAKVAINVLEVEHHKKIVWEAEQSQSLGVRARCGPVEPATLLSGFHPNRK